MWPDSVIVLPEIGERMNCRRPIAILTALILSANAATADESPTEFLQTWAAAWAESDVDRMMALYDSKKETMAIESLGRVRKGPAEIRNMYQVAFDELIFDSVSLRPITQGRHESVAWATCRYRANMRLKSDNTKLILEVLGTFVMKREHDAWKITLEHFSTIPDVPRVRPADE